MTALVHVIGYVGFHNNGGPKDPKGAIKKHVKYMIAEKEHHQNVPALFNDQEDYVDRIAFYQKINHQPDRGIVGHKMIISLSEEEWRKGKIDFRELTRETMRRYEMQNRIKLDWVAAIHMDAGHPHVHVVIRGIDEQGKQVGIYKRDLKQLQRIAEEERERLEIRNRARGMYHYDRDLLSELENETGLTPVMSQQVRGKSENQNYRGS